MPLLLSSVVGNRKSIAWWCNCGQRNEGEVRECSKCTAKLHERYAQIAQSERAVVFRNPLTGEIRRPARADQPMHPKYEAQGYVREEIMSMVAHEKETGSVHESTNFNSGSEPSPTKDITPFCPPEVKEALIRDFMAAHESGAWTMDTPLVDGPATAD